MCGRYLTPQETAIERFWSLTPREATWQLGNIDVRPTTTVPIVYESKEGTTCTPMRWGLVPYWAKGEIGKYSTFNARSEDLAKKPAYRGAWKYGKRCLFPAAGFYEWQEVEGQKQKQRWCIRVADQPVMTLAGLWDRSVKENGEEIWSATIITLPANPLLKKIHNSGQNAGRMPLILDPPDYDAWLSGDDAERLIKPFPAARMEAWPVPSKVTAADVEK